MIEKVPENSTLDKNSMKIVCHGNTYDLSLQDSQALFELLAGNSPDEGVKLVQRITGANEIAAKQIFDDLEQASHTISV